jgi:hypothetical protein
MRRLLTSVLLSICVSGLLGLYGCGGPPSPVPPEEAPTAEEPPEADPAVSHEILGSTITIVDPQGRWTFRAEADRIEAESMHGPYELKPARAVYEVEGKAPVRMTANHAWVDEDSRWAVFEGDVVVAMEGGWRLETPRLEYDLDSGEVVAADGTKQTATDRPHSAPKSPRTDEGTKP